VSGISILNNVATRITSLNISVKTTLPGNLDCGDMAINGSNAFYVYGGVLSIVDDANKTNAYINFKDADAVSEPRPRLRPGCGSSDLWPCS
jgi:hypothetical protein